MCDSREGTIKSSHTVNSVKEIIVLVIEALVNELENFDQPKAITWSSSSKGFDLPDKNGGHAPLEN